MDFWNPENIILYLAVLSLWAVLIFLFRSKISSRLITISALILLSIIISYNLISFPFFIQSNDWSLQRLPSDGFVDLFENSLSPTRTSWIYPLIEDYYQGRKLLIPDSVEESLELSPDRLKVQGRLVDVRVIEFTRDITESDLDKILELEHVHFENIRTDHSYYFVTENQDPDASLLLLKRESMFVFIPQDLLPEGEENQ